MGKIAIEFQNISKQYALGSIGTGTLSRDLNRWWARIRGKEDPYLRIGEENDRSKKATGDFVWALKDINFHVEEGEVLGIIGKNGAGKSTLLKILSRVTSPTAGCIRARGRIASLLEVGTGFHPEMTGRENIYMNGSIMGMTKAEITRKLDEIVAFAGVEKYIDTPVKRYSSGMTVCGWDLLSPPIWSRKFWWWTRCWQWEMRNSKRRLLARCRMYRKERDGQSCLSVITWQR